MDVTVTAPLETGAGHQRLVVAYTLKQGIEKQPDILSAQKSAGSATSSPMGNRPSVGSGVGLYMSGAGDIVGGVGIGSNGDVLVGGGNKSNFATTDYVSFI